MKNSVLTLGLVGLMASASAHAAEVIKPAKDNVVGNGVGALSGLMVGGVAGGPLGGVVGAGLGWMLGGQAQDVSGLSQNAYEIQEDSGEVKRVRSPSRQYAIGDQVEYRAGRIYPKNSRAEPLAD